LDDDTQSKLEITAIHDEKGYRSVRQSLAEQYNLGNREPNIQIYKANHHGDRSLVLRHTRHNRRPLNETTDEVMKHIARLWKFDVYMETMHENNRVELTHECRV
jgi:spore cortex formation protein SpoVR/YcgB (stage V sporulation)